MLQVAIALLLLVAGGPSLSLASTHAIKGHIVTPDKRPLTDAVLELSTSSGQRIRTFSDKAGGFAFQYVPPGTHLLHVLTLGYVFPELRLEVTGEEGLKKVALSHDPQQVLSSSPLLLRPLLPVTYYEVRRPVDLWAFIKSPYGLMISFMIFGLFIFPRLKVDPEEYREFQQSIGASGAGGSGGQQQQQARVRDR